MAEITTVAPKQVVEVLEEHKHFIPYLEDYVRGGTRPIPKRRLDWLREYGTTLDHLPGNRKGPLRPVPRRKLPDLAWEALLDIPAPKEADILPSAAQLITLAYPPFLAFGPLTITPGVLAATTTPFAPVVMTGPTVTPGTLSLTTTAYAPTVDTGLPEGWPAGTWCVPGVEISADAWWAGDMVANRIYYEPIFVTTTITLSNIGTSVFGGSPGQTARLGIYRADADWQPTTLVLDAGTVSVAAVSFQIIAINQQLSPGRYLLAVSSGGTPSLSAGEGGNRYAGLALPGGGAVNTLSKNATYNPYQDPGLAWDIVEDGGQSFYHTVLVKIAP